MLHIQQFVDRVVGHDARGMKDFTMSMTDAKNLHADITRLMTELLKLKEKSEKSEDEVVKVELNGGSFQYFGVYLKINTKIMKQKENIVSRPKPTVLAEIVDKSTYKTEQVLASEGVWAVFYDSKPINLKTFNLLVQYPGPKYKKVSFSNPGHAINLAKKLNVQFKTDKFSVMLLNSGNQVYP